MEWPVRRSTAQLNLEIDNTFPWMLHSAHRAAWQWGEYWCVIIFGDGSKLYMCAVQMTHVYSHVLLIIGGLSTTVLSLSFWPGEEELEISPYDDTLMDTRMASLVAGKTHSDTHMHTHTELWIIIHWNDFRSNNWSCQNAEKCTGLYSLQTFLTYGWG